MSFRNRIASSILAVGLLALLLPAVGSPQETSPQAELERALELVKAGETLQAQSLLEDIVVRWPNFRLAHYHLGRLAFGREELESARVHLTAATEGNFPQIFSAWYYLGRVLLLEERSRESTEALDRAIELAPGFAPAYLERGRARLVEGDKGGALEDLMAVLELPDSPRDTRGRARRVSRALAREAEANGDLWLALEINEQLIDRLDTAPAIEEDLARVAQTMGASDLARCTAKRALGAKPDSAETWYLLAAIETDRGDSEAAIEACERSIELGNEDVRVWLKLGELYFEQMKISESIAAYQDAMARDPRAAEAVRSFALSSLTTEQYDSLRRVLESHIEAHPDNLNTLYSLGVMSLRDNRLDEAEGYLLRLAELAPDHRQVHYSLGQLYMRQGDTARGQAEMERFAQLKQAEDEVWEHHNRAHFRRVEARRAVSEGRAVDAIPLYEQSIVDGTAEVSDYLELAAAHMEVGDADKAARAYQGVLASFPYNHEAVEGLLEAASELGDPSLQEDARRKLQILDWPCSEGDQ